MRKQIYLDANIFIAAFRGYEEDSQVSTEVIEDPGYDLVTSDFLRLELLPKAYFKGNKVEIRFLQAALNRAAMDIQSSSSICGSAIRFASEYDLQPLDALHIAAAYSAGVDEFLTLEKSSKPICRVKEVKVISICGK